MVDNKCQFEILDIEGYKCNHERCCDDSKFCIFHTKKEAKSCPEIFTKFCSELQKLYDNENDKGDWRGFIFPETFKLTNFTVNHIIDLSYSTFGKIELNSVTFQKTLLLNKCIFNDSVQITQRKFDSNFSCQESVFHGDLKIHCNFDGTTRFNQSIFYKSVRFCGGFNNKTSFESCIFHESVIFLGGRDITVSIGKEVPYNEMTPNIRRLFHDEVIMHNVSFYSPEKVRFMAVDMSSLLLIGTNLKGVLLYDTQWYQRDLKRNGLGDEVSIHKNNDSDYRRYIFPRIESQYRNVRVALEENKNFTLASDFYIGEMEIRRMQLHPLKRYIFSIEAFYNTLSRYGTDPKKSFMILMQFYLIHVLLTICFQAPDFTTFSFALFDLECLSIILEKLAIYLINSLKVVTLMRFGPFIENGLSQTLIDTIFRIIGPFQLALLVMAMRNRIRRN